MKNNSSGKNSYRRDFLRYSGLVTFVGFAGFTGLNLGSEPAIAAPTGSPSIADGIVSGEHPVSPYDIEYQNLDTSRNIVITYIFTDSNENETKLSHSVSLSGEPESGTINTGSHSVTVPSGEIQLVIQLSHPSLSNTLSTSPSSKYTVSEPPVAYQHLVAWYPFDTSSIQDSSSNNNDGSISGSPNYISNSGPLENGAYDFDGTDDFINIPNSPSISLTSEITESAWVLSENHQDRGTVATKNGSYYFQVNSDGGVETYTYYGTNSRRSSDYFDSSNNIPEGVWTHIAWTEDTSGLRTIYINGTVDSTSQHEPGIYDSSKSLRIGAQGSSSRQFNGKIRDVRVYNRELSASEIDEIYRNTSDVHKQSNLLIWLPFSNGKAVEKSSNRFNVSVSGATALANGGPSGRGAFSFDGSSDRIDLGNPDVDLSQSISVCFWAKPNTDFTSRRNPIDKSYGGEFAFTFEDDQRSDQFSSYFGSSGRDSNPYRSTPFTNAVFPNTWTHYVWTRDNTSQTIELYINGSKSSNKNSSDPWETPSQSDDSLLIGDGYTNSFKGDITGVRIYDIVLDESDANIIYNNRK